MPFALAALSSMLYGVADFLGGMGSRRAPVIAVTTWFQLTGLVCLVLYAAFAPGVTRLSDLAWGAASGAAGGLGVTLLYHVLASGTVSTAAPLISMVALTVPVAVGLVSGERPGLLPLLGVAIGCVAAITTIYLCTTPPILAPLVPNARRQIPFREIVIDDPFQL